MTERLQQFLAEKRQPVQQEGPVNLRASIAEMNNKQHQKGVIPYLGNIVSNINQGVTQVAETPYNIVNRAPQLLNLLPGEQGIGTIDEMAEGTPLESVFPSKDPLIEYMTDIHPGIAVDNPNYPKTSQFSEDVGIGLGSMGLTGVASAAPGSIGKLASTFFTPVKAAPAAAVAGEVAASAGAAGGRELSDKYDMGPVGSFMAEFLGSLGPATVSTSLANLAGKTMGIGREGGQEALEAMDRIGVRPSVGLTGGQHAATMENAAAIVPIMGGKAKAVQKGQLDDFGDALTKASTDIRGSAVSQADEMSLGSQVMDIADEGLGRIKNEFGGREDDLMEAIGARTPVNIERTRATIEDMIPKVDPELQAGLKAELDALDAMVDEAGNVPYEQLRSYRTNVGKRTNQPSLQGGQKKQIYKSLTADTQSVADAKGVGDDFTNLMSEQATAHDKTLRLSEGGDIPAAEALGKKQLEGGRTFFKQSLANPDRAEFLKRNATPEQWKQFTGDTAEYLGLAKDSAQGAAGDAFSPNTFLTNWNKMDPRTKLILFDDDLGTLQTLEDIATVSEAFQMRGNATNFSNTAGVGMGATALAGASYPIMSGNVPGALAAAGITMASIEGLMSEALGRWAAGSGPSITGTIGARVPGAIGRASTDEE